MNQTVNRLFSIAFVIIFVMSLIERILIGENFLYGTYIDRDLMRAFKIPGQNYIYGPELSITGRTPGGFYYYILKFIELISFNKTYLIYLFSNSVSFLLSLTIFHKILEVLNIKNNAVFLAMFTSVGFMLDYSLTFWNPTLTLPFHFLIAYLLISYFTSPLNVSWKIVLSFLLIGLTTQLHLSGLLHIPIFLFFIIYQRNPIPLKVILSSVGALLICYAPLLIGLGEYGSAYNAAVDVLTSKENDPISSYQLILRIMDYSFSGLGYFDNGLREYPRWIFSKGLAAYLNPTLLNYMSRGLLFVCFYSLYLSIFKPQLLKLERRSWHILLFTLLMFSFFTYFLVLSLYGDYALNFRRIYPLIPYILTFIAVSIKIVIDKSPTTIVKNVMLFLILMCLGLNLLNFRFREMPSFSIFSDYKSVIKIAKRDLHLNNSMIKTNIVISKFDNHILDCHLLVDDLTYDSGGIDYLLLGEDVLDNSLLNRTCFLVMKESDQKACLGKINNLIDPSSNLKHYKNFSNFTVYTYDKSSCFSSLHNKYLTDK
ncbi:MAG: hypothetical protein K9K67_08210 [Bacteriovoracaceae bacterium]|nr:hypothetical protein [Bacteriovoracaceae bacterium]